MIMYRMTSNLEFKNHPKFGLKALIPPINNKVQLSIRTDYDYYFGVRAG